ncbi:hypothetical protein H4219_001459 [Mycoemilia scoparia]|uniref:WD repeat domain-containing protein 83 n=1 Tax=Mycoemilia scoparia TaxID=417184 RepID=A0A9W8A5V8_9FUNG|nr:hypothetical protein H4219_001459 [Mycoemilia scoparia]
MDKTARLWDCRSVDGQVRTYDLRKGQLTSDYIGSPVTSVCQSDDGKCLLVTTLDDCIRLFDRYDGSLLNSYRGHKNKNYRIQSRLNNSDEYIATGSEDGSIVIWDLLDANIQRRLHHHQNIVTSVIFHPKDQTRMASASADGSIVLWCK